MIQLINEAYDVVVQWKRNIFLVPSGKVGKAFVSEITCLVRGYAEATAFEGIALKAVVVMQVLLLQKPHARSKSRDHVQHLSRRLDLWKNGDVQALIREGSTIQKRIKLGRGRVDDDHIARIFSKLMLEGKVKSALRYVTDNVKGGVLSLDNTVTVKGDNGQQEPKSVLDILHSKHPEGRSPTEGSLLAGPVEHVDPIIFEALDGKLIRDAALRTTGAAGPSGVDADGWRRICVSFHGASNDLCEALASLARRLCTNYVDPTGIEALVTCRLIPLDKCPGVRPIGIGETPRRIMAKAIMSVLRPDILEVAGSLQLCAGQEAGCEAAIHAMRTIFTADDCDAVLLVDANNAFNTLNRMAALHNIRVLCPAFATILINTYRVPVNLLVAGGGSLVRKEGTTQGDPLAMGMYALGIQPLLNRLEGLARQVYGTPMMPPVRAPLHKYEIGGMGLLPMAPLMAMKPMPTKHG